MSSKWPRVVLEQRFVNKPDILIIGGGIIGAACAFEMTRRGASVVVIDKREIGHGCSYGNAGWVTPCFAMPLPMPGMFFKSLKWLIDPDSPLYIKPTCSWQLVRWLLRFLRSMNVAAMQRAVTALTELSKYSLEEYRRLDAERPGAFELQLRGLLMVATTGAGLDATRLQMTLVGQHGIPGRELDADGVRALEPAITGSDLCGGVFFPNEAHMEPLAAVRALVEGAQARGADVRPQTEVFEIERSGRRVLGLKTTRGWIEADQIVLATGAWSPQFASSLDLRVPVLSGKGYAVIVEPFLPAPRIPCMLIEKKVAVTPRKSTVRLAGTLELVGVDETITPRRVQAMINGARQYLSVPAEPQIVEVWRGLRPCTPDGLPIIGRPPHLDNVVVATGHQMLGLQTAPATGRLVADLLTGQSPAFDPSPFRTERF